MKYIIFNADDFNLSDGVNKGIIQSHKLGAVRSTTVLINLPNPEKAVALIDQHPTLDGGIHINLTFGRPVSDRKEVPSLVDDDGIFWRSPDMLFSKGTKEDFEAEIQAQVDLAKKLGLDFNHLDSHHHIHKNETIFRIMTDIAIAEKVAIRSYSNEMRRALADKKVPSPDCLFEDFFGENNVSLDKIDSILRAAVSGFSEIMCHPGYVDEQLLDVSSYTKTREKEVMLLTHPRVMQMLQEYKLKLAGYREILEFYTGS